MKIYIYDFEVLRYDWIVVFMDYETREFTVFHNDCQAVRWFMDGNRVIPDSSSGRMDERDFGSYQVDDAIYIGFNSKSYDQYIMKAVCCGCDNDEIKELNDFLIKGGNGWEHPLMNQIRYWFNNVDIRDDTQQGLSLKAIEGHLGMSVQESSIDFNIDHPLNEDELAELIHYCKHDVEATAQLVKVRKNYLMSKIQVGRMAGLDDVKSLSMTNAKLTAAFLQARRPNQPWTDERKYAYPANLKREYIPQEVFDFFDRMYNPNVTDDELFKSKLKITLGQAQATIGFGGIHLGIPNYVWEGEKSDVESSTE